MSMTCRPVHVEPPRLPALLLERQRRRRRTRSAAPPRRRTASPRAEPGDGAQANQLYGSTSRGPTDDGRLKPTICAPATLNSAYGSSDTGYTTYSGTSMASPAMAGATVLLRQYLTDGWYPTGAPVAGNRVTAPSAALLKAMAINSADPDVNGYTVPDNNIGWGRIDDDQVLYFPGDARRLVLVDSTDGTPHRRVCRVPGLRGVQRDPAQGGPRLDRLSRQPECRRRAGQRPEPRRDRRDDDLQGERLFRRPVDDGRHRRQPQRRGVRAPQHARPSASGPSGSRRPTSRSDRSRSHSSSPGASRATRGSSCSTRPPTAAPMT